MPEGSDECWYNHLDSKGWNGPVRMKIGRSRASSVAVRDKVLRSFLRVQKITKTFVIDIFVDFILIHNQRIFLNFILYKIQFAQNKC